MVADIASVEDDCFGKDASLPSTPHVPSTCTESLLPVKVTIGTSALDKGDFCLQLATMVNEAYGHHRLSSSEVSHRLAMGDGCHCNRVLHIAWRGNTVVGCCSSTLQTPWCPRGCGHWGLVSVDVDAQGTGVGSALVRAAEHRLSEAGLSAVQIEYGYTCGDPDSERLLAWYEGTLGFDGGGRPCSRPGSSEFRRCRKLLGTSPKSTAVASAGKTTAVTAAEAQRQSLGCWAVLLRLLRRIFGGARS